MIRILIILAILIPSILMGTGEDGTEPQPPTVTVGAGAAKTPAPTNTRTLTLTSTPTLARTAPPTETAAPTQIPTQAPTSNRQPAPSYNTRIAIPKFGVDAPIVVKGVDADGVMESSNGAYDVAWYDFTAWPGTGGNAVFSGHVDYVGVGPAVFWHLKDLVQGDVVEVHLVDGAVYEYRVASKEQLYAGEIDVGEVTGRTEQEIITLITCAGTFDPSVGDYDQRLIVRAERID